MMKAMRDYAFGVAAATALFVIPISAFSQSIEVDREVSGYTTAEGVGNASNCGVPAKTRTHEGSGVKEIAVGTGRPAKDQLAGMSAVN